MTAKFRIFLLSSARVPFQYLSIVKTPDPSSFSPDTPFKEPRNGFHGIDSANLFSLAGRYNNPIPSRFLAPIHFLKYGLCIL